MLTLHNETASVETGRARSKSSPPAIQATHVPVVETPSALATEPIKHSAEKWRLQKLVFVTVAINILILASGFQGCVTSVILPAVKTSFYLCQNEFSCLDKSLFIAISAPGGVLGCLLGGMAADAYGRMTTMIIGAKTALIGIIAYVTATNYTVVLLGRFLTGAAFSVVFSAAPLYLAEVAPANQRGKFVAFIDLSQCLGCIFPFLLAGVLEVISWRVLASTSCILIIIGVIWLFRVPESPRYLLAKNKKEYAITSMNRLGWPKTQQKSLMQKYECIEGRVNGAVEMNIISEEVGCSKSKEEKKQNLSDSHSDVASTVEGDSAPKKAAESDEAPISRWTLARRKWRSLVFLACFGLIHNFIGAHALQHFYVDLLALAGMCSSIIPGIAIACSKICGALCSLPMVETVGRRKMIIIGSILSSFFNMIIAGVLLYRHISLPSNLLYSCAKSSGFEVANFQESSFAFNSSDWMLNRNTDLVDSATSISFVCLFCCLIFAWSMTWAPLMPVVASEVLPSSIQGFGVGLCFCSFSVGASITQLTIEPLLEAITPQGTFFLFASFSLISVVFSYLFVPERKGKELETPI